MRQGITTGTCATAASVLAALRLRGQEHQDFIPVQLPDGTDLKVSMLGSGVEDGWGWAMVRKDSGDDPDITHGAQIRVEVRATKEAGVQFHAGKGVGTVTLPGLQIAVGEAAINPVPRRMIRDHLLALAPGWEVKVAVENGDELAQQTFNPRLGVLGGISILGTSGRVRPFSHESQLCSIRCAFGIANAAGVRALALVPGHMGERALKNAMPELTREAIIEVGNDWGFALELVTEMGPEALVIAGHPGKLAKFLAGHWDTHSSRSPSALPIVQEFWAAHGCPVSSSAQTVEGFLQAAAQESNYELIVLVLHDAIAASIQGRIPQKMSLTLLLTNLTGGVL